eukprot:1062772-Rhodomonas_salina.2
MLLVKNPQEAETVTSKLGFPASMSPPGIEGVRSRSTPELLVRDAPGATCTLVACTFTALAPVPNAIRTSPTAKAGKLMRKRIHQLSDGDVFGADAVGQVTEAVSWYFGTEKLHICHHGLVGAERFKVARVVECELMLQKRFTEDEHIASYYSIKALSRHTDFQLSPVAPRASPARRNI